MIIKLNKYGGRIFEQETGTKIGKEILEQYNRDNTFSTLDCEGVSSVNTAFFNALISVILPSANNVKKLTSYFRITNANEVVKSALVVSIQLAEFSEGV